MFAILPFRKFWPEIYIVKDAEPAVTLEGNRPLMEGVGFTTAEVEVPQLDKNAASTVIRMLNAQERGRIKTILRSNCPNANSQRRFPGGAQTTSDLAAVPINVRLMIQNYPAHGSQVHENWEQS